MAVEVLALLRRRFATIASIVLRENREAYKPLAGFRVPGIYRVLNLSGSDDKRVLKKHRRRAVCGTLGIRNSNSVTDM
jgi:hypothetical protein